VSLPEFLPRIGQLTGDSTSGRSYSMQIPRFWYKPLAAFNRLLALNHKSLFFSSLLVVGLYFHRILGTDSFLKSKGSGHSGPDPLTCVNSLNNGGASGAESELFRSGALCLLTKLVDLAASVVCFLRQFSKAVR